MFSPRFLSLLSASLLISPSLGVTLTSLTQLTSSTFDYIIVGAGTAGLVVANRLTEDPSVSVLVLEAGVSDQGVLAAIAPFLGPTLTPNTPFDWNYSVTPQAALNGRSFAFPRGRMLGGSSSVNYLIHQYGAAADWDRYAKVAGDSSWSWNNMQKYVQKHEKLVPPIDGHNTTGQFIPSLHGFNGEVLTTLPAINQTIDARVMATTGELHSQFPYNEDISGGKQTLLGMGFAQSTAGNGVRSSSSTSYLAQANTRPNLTVVINTTVTKLIQTGTSGSLKAFRSLSATSSPGTASTPAGLAPRTLTARKEIILSAGSFGSIQILQLSGIGDSSYLSSLGIKTLINNPSVGSDMSDHPFLPTIFSVNSNDTFDDILRGNPTVINDVVGQWVASKTGVIANTVVNNMGFFRLPSNSSIFKTVSDPASGPGSPHFELLPTNFFLSPGVATPATGSFFTIVIALISPTSRGSVKIRSTNPFDKPIIDPQYLTTPFDVFALRESVKAAKTFASAKAWSDYIIGPFGELANTSTDDEIDAFVRDTTTTIFHPTGTAAMSSSNSKTGVVNSDLTVKGAAGLRIVDASVFPFVPSSHTQGPTYLLAEHASDIIKSCNYESKMKVSALVSLALISLFSPSLAVTIASTSQLKNPLTYDYIIVGGGNAGLVIASRLTEDPSVTVLVLEAGVSDQGVVAAEAPFLGPTLTPNSPFDWNFTVVPQQGMKGRTFAYPRGHLLGGSSSANYLFHQYGTDEDWNRLAKVSGDSGWAWSNVQKYVQKHEKFVPPVDGHNTAGQFIPSLHGFHGEVSVSLPGFNQTIDSRVLEVTKQLPEFPFNEDTSGGSHSVLGIGFLQSSAGGGVRSSSSTSYLANANNRRGLTVVINAYVTKLVSTGNGQKPGNKAFRSVQFTSSPGTGPAPGGSKSLTATARKEVILSAGSIGTPQILKLSGIGNSAELKSLGINTIVQNTDIGENLSDHTLLPNIFSVKGDLSFDHILRSSSQTQAVLDQWIQNKTGLFANNVVNNFGFARLPSSTLKTLGPDPAAGPKSPHYEMIFSNFYFNPGFSTPSTGSFMTFVTVLISPTSRGTVKLRSNNAFDKPLIDPQYLTTKFDIAAMRESVKAIKRFAGAPAFSDYVIGPFGSPFSTAKTDAQIEDYVRGLTTTIFHPVGTASMSPQNSKTGVVNPDLTVKGIEGLRIVDASVFPFVPSTHTQGPVYLLAERAADLIKQSDKI
ncbi:hypothetical protein CVT26_010014 [Gymnopilus dilepis]|uniref:pyranose dehydrogenase (acceptor) n=1 Tax=Gymnopilus dilepis TaxID=231916 RepID=A0A409VKY1_9AGAR|nr:hypothetical protein CVT26_010014 [Gymnopilus dilepis]